MNQSDKKKYLLIKAKGGMGNRMLCVVTGILYGQLSGRAVVVDWRDQAYSNDGSNVFSRFFACSGVYPEMVLPRKATIHPKVWQGQLDKSMSQMMYEHDPTKHNSLLIHRKYSIDVKRLDYDEEIAVFWYYKDRLVALMKNLAKKGHAFAGLSRPQIIRNMLTKHMPVQEQVHRRIEEFKARYWHDNVIGLHIRHTDRRTNLRKYERAVQHFLRWSPGAHIFLATDNQKVSNEYHSKFKNVFSTPKWFPGGLSSMHQNDSCPDKIANGIEALVDMYLLAECDYLIYPGCSTFSWISRVLSNIGSDRVVDIDRYNPKVQLKRLIREVVA